MKKVLNGNCSLTKNPRWVLQKQMVLGRTSSLPGKTLICKSVYGRGTCTEVEQSCIRRY